MTDRKRHWLAVAAWVFFAFLSVGNILDQLDGDRSTVLLVLWIAMLAVSLAEIARAVCRRGSAEG